MVSLTRGECHYRYDGIKNKVPFLFHSPLFFPSFLISLFLLFFRCFQGRLVVLIHGFVGCHLCYNYLTDHLVKTGLFLTFFFFFFFFIFSPLFSIISFSYCSFLLGKRRVLRLDNYGRGWSSLPHNHVSPSPELYAGQLSDLLFHLGETEKIDLVCYF